MVQVCTKWLCEHWIELACFAYLAIARTVVTSAEGAVMCMVIIGPIDGIVVTLTALNANVSDEVKLRGVCAADDILLNENRQRNERANLRGLCSKKLQRNSACEAGCINASPPARPIRPKGTVSRPCTWRCQQTCTPTQTQTQTEEVKGSKASRHIGNKIRVLAYVHRSNLSTASKAATPEHAYYTQ